MSGSREGCAQRTQLPRCCYAVGEDGARIRADQQRRRTRYPGQASAQEPEHHRRHDGAEEAAAEHLRKAVRSHR